jgi:hypothetical protein
MESGTASGEGSIVVTQKVNPEVWGVAQAAEYLPNKLQGLRTNPSDANKETNKRRTGDGGASL